MKRREFLSAAAAAAGASLVPSLASAADAPANGRPNQAAKPLYPSGPPQAPRRDFPPVTAAEEAEDKKLREDLVKSLWTPERAYKYMERFGVIKGCNYVPAYAHSHAHMWFDYREGEIQKELELGKADRDQQRANVCPLL